MVVRTAFNAQVNSHPLFEQRFEGESLHLLPHASGLWRGRQFVTRERKLPDAA
jgi:hypothetical protein